MFNHLIQWSIPSFAETIAKIIVLGLAVDLLPKTEYGYINIGMLLFGYAGFTQLGVADALMLKLPEYNVLKQNKKYHLKIKLLG